MTDYSMKRPARFSMSSSYTYGEMFHLLFGKVGKGCSYETRTSVAADAETYRKINSAINAIDCEYDLDDFSYEKLYLEV